MTKRRLVICLAIAVAIVLAVGLGAGCNPYLGSGTIVVKATLNGVDWPTTGTANVNYRLKLDSPPTNNMQGDTVPHTVQPCRPGTGHVPISPAVPVGYRLLAPHQVRIWTRAAQSPLL